MDYQYTQLYSLTRDLKSQRSITLPQHFPPLPSFYKGTMAVSWSYMHYWKAMNWEQWPAIMNQAMPPICTGASASEDTIKQQKVFGSTPCFPSIQGWEIYCPIKTVHVTWVLHKLHNSQNDEDSYVRVINCGARWGAHFSTLLSSIQCACPGVCPGCDF